MDTKRITLVGMLAVVVALGFASSAQALDFTWGGGSTVSHYNYGGAETQDGLGIRTGDPRDGSVAAVSPISAPVPTTFSLNVGESQCFDFFDIWTHEGTLESSNDEGRWTITATVDLSPADAAIVITGTASSDHLSGQGTYASTAGANHGVVTWDGPVTVTAGLCTYTVTLSNETFNWGCESGYGEEFGGKGNDGWDGRAVVEACVELIDCDGGGQEPIPEPAGLSLIGLALLTIRKRRS